MKLTDVIKEIENIDEEAIIFKENRENPNSDIILSFAPDGDQGIKEVERKKYYYLIEVFLAKEFVDDWEASLNYKPSIDEKSKRVYEYATNDA